MSFPVILALLAAIPRRIVLIGVAAWRFLLMVGEALRGLVHLARAGLKARKGEAGGLTSPEGFRAVFAVARLFAPVARLPIRVVQAYANDATALVSRYDDVVDVMSRPEDFEATYAPRMAEVTGANVFVLGLGPGETYARDIAAISAAMRRTDVEARIAPLSKTISEALIAKVEGRLDVPADYTKRMPARLLIDYFGLPDEEDILIGATEDAFNYIFFDLAANDAVKERGLRAAARLRDHLDRAIAAEKTSPSGKDTVLARFLAQQKLGLPGNSDEEIRSNLIGLMSGTIPTMSRLTTLALDELMRRARPLARAQAAAREGDLATVAAHMWEASRFNPFGPMLYRRARRDAVVARSSLRARRIKKDTLVFVATTGAMFDPLEVGRANAFRTDRPWRHYMLWGEGFHACLGEAWNKVMIPAMAAALLAKPGLRRAPGAAGEVDLKGTPYPQSWTVEWD